MHVRKNTADRFAETQPVSCIIVAKYEFAACPAYKQGVTGKAVSWELIDEKAIFYGSQKIGQEKKDF